MTISINPESGLHQATIDESRYEFELWGAQSSLETLFDIAAILGKPLVQLVALAQNDPNANLADVLGPQAGLAGLDGIVEHLTAQLSTNRDKTLTVIQKLSSGSVLCDGKKFKFDAHYQNRLAHLFAVVRAAIEVQYGDFFAALAPLAGLRKAEAAASASQAA